MLSPSSGPHDIFSHTKYDFTETMNTYTLL